MEVQYCKKCHNKKKNKNYDTSIQEIMDAAQVDEVEEVCISFCGPGAKNHIAAVDGEIIVDQTYDGMIEQIKQKR